MAQAVIRPLIDGGCSVCIASEENVGKRKCRHVLSEAVMTVEKEGSTRFVDIEGVNESGSEKFSIKATEADIKNYISTLSKALTDEQKQEILAEIR